MNPRRLYRCRDDRKIAGVAAGMAEYLELDPTVVRVAWILSALFGGFTILIYVILAFVMPIEPTTSASVEGTQPDGSEPSDVHAEGEPEASAATAHVHRSKDGRPGMVGMVFGVMLIAFGVIALGGSFIPAWMSGVHLGPALILAIGIAIVVGATRGSATNR